MVFRSLFIILTCAALAASGVVLYQHVQRDGVGEVLHALSFRQSGAAAAAEELLAAATVLEKAHERDETYAHADLRRFKHLVVAYAGKDNYCIQVEKARKWFHVVGPRGVPANGTC